MGYYRLHVQLNEEDPADSTIIAALEQLGERGKSRWVRRVLFEAVTEPARSDIMAEIRAIKEAVERLETRGIALAHPADDAAADEPAAAAHNLDNMLDRLSQWK